MKKLIFIQVTKREEIAFPETKILLCVTKKIKFMRCNDAEYTSVVGSDLFTELKIKESIDDVVELINNAMYFRETISKRKKYIIK